MGMQAIVPYGVQAGQAEILRGLTHVLTKDRSGLHQNVVLQKRGVVRNVLSSTVVPPRVCSTLGPPPRGQPLGHISMTECNVYRLNIPSQRRINTVTKCRQADSECSCLLGPLSRRCSGLHTVDILALTTQILILMCQALVLSLPATQILVLPLLALTTQIIVLHLLTPTTQILVFPLLTLTTQSLVFPLLEFTTQILVFSLLLILLCQAPLLPLLALTTQILILLCQALLLPLLALTTQILILLCHALLLPLQLGLPTLQHGQTGVNLVHGQSGIT